MKRLTDNEIEARMDIYQEILGHLDMEITETKTERKQADIVRKQIKSMSERFYAKHKRV